MTNTSSTYDLTLVNDYTFYMAVIEGDYDTVFTVATRLYNTHHSKDGLTIQERFATIAAAVDYLTSE